MIHRVVSWLKMVRESVDLRTALMLETVRADVAEESARQIEKAYKSAIKQVVQLNEAIESRKNDSAKVTASLESALEQLRDARRENAISDSRVAGLQKLLDETGSNEALAWHKARVVDLEAEAAFLATELSRVQGISDGYLKEARLSVEANKVAKIQALQECKAAFTEKLKSVNRVDVYPIGGIEIPAYLLLTWMSHRIGDMIDGKPIQDPARK